MLIFPVCMSVGSSICAVSHVYVLVHVGNQVRMRLALDSLLAL
jgi:hypothetical protein